MYSSHALLPLKAYISLPEWSSCVCLYCLSYVLGREVLHKSTGCVATPGRSCFALERVGRRILEYFGLGGLFLELEIGELFVLF